MNSRVDVATITDALRVTQQAVWKRAGKERWPYEETTVRGGRKRLYPITSLPADVQTALAEKALSAAPVVPPPSPLAAGALFSSTRGSGRGEGEPRQAESGSSPDPRSETLTVRFDAKPESLKAEARARLAIVAEFNRLVALGIERQAAASAVQRERNVSAATLSRYLAIVRGQPEHLWLALLCPAYAGRTATAEMSAEAWETLKADYLRAERPSASACISRLRRVAHERGWTLPSNRTLLRRLEQIPRGIKVAKREGMKALKALYPAQQRDKGALAALQVINGDGYPHNLWVRFPDGEIVRAKTWFWQDVHSSKVLAWRTDKTEHTDVIRLSFGDLVERYGIPEAVVIDNTLAAANKTMSGGIKHRFRFRVRDDEPDGVFKLLGIDLHWATPAHGQAKPVERVFGVGGIGEVIDKAPEFAGAWTGSSPIDKPEYDGSHRAVELADLEAAIAREIEHFNAMPGRRGAVHQGRSFDEVFNASYQRIEIRKATEAQRRLWLLATEPVRAAAKDGALTLEAGSVKGDRYAKNRYWHSALIDHAGRPLVARFDPRRLHQGVHVYTVDGRWLCFAECDRPAGFLDANAARERNRARNTWKRGVKLQAQAEVRMSALDAAKTLTLPSAGGVADSTIPAPRVLRPVFADPLERPRYVPKERSPEELAALDHFEVTAAAPAPVNVLELRSDADKHAYWQSLDARRGAGEQLADQEAEFWSHWQTQTYFRVAREADQEFEQRLANG